MWLPGTWGRGPGEFVFNGHRDSTCKMKRVLVVDASDSYATVGMSFMLENNTLEMLKEKN